MFKRAWRVFYGGNFIGIVWARNDAEAKRYADERYGKMPTHYIVERVFRDRVQIE